jgi:hypothetical protein
VDAPARGAGCANTSAEAGSRGWVGARPIDGSEGVCRPRSILSRGRRGRRRDTQLRHYPGRADSRAFGRASHRAAVHIVMLVLHLRRGGHRAIGGGHGRCRSRSNGQRERKPQHGEQAPHVPPIGRSGMCGYAAHSAPSDSHYCQLQSNNVCGKCDFPSWEGQVADANNYQPSPVGRRNNNRSRPLTFP